MAKSYPTIKFDDQLVNFAVTLVSSSLSVLCYYNSLRAVRCWVQADSLLTKLVQVPTQFDVLLCPNLFGDLVSDLAAGLIGSLGFMPSGQFGDQYDSVPASIMHALIVVL